MTQNSLKERLAAKEILLMDGAMGSELMKHPEYTGNHPSELNITYPGIVTMVHKSYVDAGAELVITNTFDVNPRKYENYAKIISAAVKNARDSGAMYVGLDIGPIGELLHPMGLLTVSDAFSCFKALALEGVKNAVDFFMVETVTDENEAREALRAIREVSDLPVILSGAFNKRGGLFVTGCKPEGLAKIADEFGADAVGANCSYGPDLMLPLIESFASATSLPIVAKPNAGLPDMSSGKAVYNVGASEFAGYMEKLVEAGASVIGGCCGTTAEHIAAIRR
ncbi:MAG: homocysteine S-methyltransferase family protein [Clostridia bacterium]|nr:homocysteine S-methyltransferase family protein [Clostridia bacterium]MBR5991654.1 homocysteine S-methyltransferase family protein [Clostridia bacterium]MBR6479905.1 homocysteine S-methyltransferase family protein [Clostridia bacterium]